ncbi:unnamed protein product, partial [Prunus brigantina]
KSSPPSAQPSSAATVPAQMDHLLVGPEVSQAPASSASSVAQPVSTRSHHRPASTTDTTSTDATGALGSQPAKKNTRGPCRQLKTAKMNYNLEDLDDESLAYANRLFTERYKQWKSDLHHHFQAFDDPQNKAKVNKGNRNKKTLLHHSGSRPFSYRMNAWRQGGSKGLNKEA